MKKIAAAVIIIVIALVALFFLMPKSQPHNSQINFGNSSYYMSVSGAGIGITQNQSIREKVLDMLLSDFYDRDAGLFYEFNQNGSFSAEKLNVFGPPYYFKEHGYDEISGFNAFVGNALLKNATHVADAENLADAIHSEFLDAKSGSYNILKSSGEYRGAVNDAIVGSFYLELYEVTGKEKYREWAKQVFDAIITNYVAADGKLNCCIVYGNLSTEMYTRDGLVVASFVYAYRVLGDESYHETAKKIADYYIANHYKKDGYFDKWENAGTDAEIALGLIELYKIDRDSGYRDILFSQFRYWSGRNLRNENISVVDEAEQFIFYVKMHELFDGNIFLQTAKSKWATLENCYSEKYGFPHVCNGDTYYSAIDAIVLLAYV